MVRLAVVLDRDLGIGVDALAAAWDADDEARHLGPAEVEPAGAGVFQPGLIELVAIPLAVNVASGALYDLLKRLITKLRGAGKASSEELEIVEVETASGHRLIVVRSRQQGR
jgi:hypothetical protein